MGIVELNRSLNSHTMTRDKGVPQGPQPGTQGIAELQPPRLRRGQSPGSPSRAGAPGSQQGTKRHPAALSAFPASRSSPALLQQHEAFGFDAWKGGTACLDLNY